MSLTSRVDPFGNLFADSSRGQFMGNRGRIHRIDKTVSTYKFAHQHWICCKLEFNNRHRRLWGDSYTDEVTAFAAGHRPCFECRRKDAEWFATLFSGKRQRASAATMDNAQRVVERQAEAHASLRARSSARRCDDRARRRSLCGARELSAALDAIRLFESKAAPARYRDGRAHAAIDARDFRARLCAVLHQSAAKY